MDIEDGKVDGHIECSKPFDLQIVGPIFIISNKHMAPCALCLKCLRKPLLNVLENFWPCTLDGRDRSLNCNDMLICTDDSINRGKCTSDGQPSKWDLESACSLQN